MAVARLEGILACPLAPIFRYTPHCLNRTSMQAETSAQSLPATMTAGPATGYLRRLTNALADCFTRIGTRHTSGLGRHLLPTRRWPSARSPSSPMPSRGGTPSAAGGLRPRDHLDSCAWPHAEEPVAYTRLPVPYLMCFARGGWVGLATARRKSPIHKLNPSC